jgi:hypothetical protein
MAGHNPSNVTGSDGIADSDVRVVQSILPDGASTSANQISGGQKTQIVGSNGLSANVNNQGQLETHLSAPIVFGGTMTVTATDLDIRNLANATDSVAIYGSDDGGTTKRIILTSASGAITETNSSTIAEDTTSIDGKITACNTGAVVIASGTITTVPANNITDATYIGDIKFGEALPAGTAAIGSITNTALIGPGNPVVDSYSNATISAAANTANQSLIAAPGASKQIWVFGINFTAGTGDGSASFQDEDDTAISGVMPFAQNGGMVVAPSGNFSMPLWKVATNKALEVDTVTCDIKGSIQYAIISV